MLRLSVRLFRRVLRPVVAAGSVLCLLGATTGIPVWHVPGKASSEPFPCQHCGCSCGSAEQCWRDCCCFTMVEKLAWAKEHAVEPPAFVLAAVAQEQQATHSCCSAKQAAGRSCCSTTKKSVSPATEAAEPGRLTFVISMLARKCQGLEQLWLAVSAAVPVQPITWGFDWRLVEIIASPEPILISLRIPPPTPPPLS